MPRVLVTGIGGFAGSHLADHLLGIPGVYLGGVVHPTESTAHIGGHLDRIALHRGDLCDREFVQGVVRDFFPEYVLHLAAQSVPAASLDSPALTLTNNIVGQLNVLEAARVLAPMPRVLVVGSGDEYGLVTPQELPLTEDSPLRPSSPYAVSKIAQDFLGYQYYLSYRVPVVRVRPFNHTGPRQSEPFVLSGFAKQVAAAELGLGPPVIKVGNLDARRDFSDVRDIVKGYWLAATIGEEGAVYNIGSGRSLQIKEALELLLGWSTMRLSVEADPARLRPADVPDLVCDSSRFRSLCGWEPQIPFERTLADLLAYWRAILATPREVS